MKKKAISSSPVTEEKLKEVLSDYPTKKETKSIVDEALENYPTNWDMDKKFDEMDRKWDDRFIQFKSDIFTRFDELMGELAQIREDRIFTDHDNKVINERVDEHEVRIKKLETS